MASVTTRVARSTESNLFTQLAAANHDRFALWVPVLFGCGIAVYFLLPSEPLLWTGFVGFGGFAAVTLLLYRRRGAFFIASIAALASAAGFVGIQLRTNAVDAPKIEQRIGPVAVTGSIVHLEPKTNGVRLLLDQLSVERLEPSATPERIRLTVRYGGKDLRAGDRVHLLAILQPPPEPAIPGGFDFARKAWFERIGAVGFALGRPRATDPAEVGSFSVALARVRQFVTARILRAGDPATAPVAAALMTGERKAIPEQTLADMRDSGLAHLLAISGLHIGLIAGLLFFTVRLGLSAVEGVALRWPIKKIAAMTALAGAFCYLLISGSPIPTQRAFMMVAISLCAIMIDRNAISMRLVALAAVIVLLIAPESLLSASFQMSFAAVIGLVAVYEAAGSRLARARAGGVIVSRVWVFLAGTILTTMIASLATGPFAIYHFNRLALYGLLANLLAVPLTGLWIMPWAILAFLLMPFGLEEIALVPMGWGIDAVLAIAAWTASLPGAVALIPPMTTPVLCVVALAGLWLCLWRGPLRYASIPVLVVALGSLVFARTPDVLIDGEARLFAVRLGDGTVVMPPGNGNRFQRDIWLRHLTAPAASDPPRDRVMGNGGMACDRDACLIRLNGQTVSLVFGPAAMREDCARADHLILMTRSSRSFCHAGSVVGSTFGLWRDGAHAFYFSADGNVSVETARTLRGDRPWSRVSMRKRQYLRTSPTKQP